MARQKKSDTAWSQPSNPPPPLFTGEKERNLVKQVNDELIERVIGQQVLYYSIDVEKSNFHPLYGETINKTFLPPIRVHALVKFDGIKTTADDSFGLDKSTKLEIHFHKKRLTDDQNLYVREGDFVMYGDTFYEIVLLSEPKRLFGQIENRFEIIANCIRARQSLFEAPIINSKTNPLFTTPISQTTSTSTGSASTYTNPSTITVGGLITNTLTVSSTSTFNGAIVYGSVLVSGSYNIISTDYLVGVNTTNSTCSITLPSVTTTTSGRTIVIKDETGNASTNPIHISASSGETIDGLSVFSIESDHGAVMLYCTSTGWHVT
jgi:hypothetical protein